MKPKLIAIFLLLVLSPLGLLAWLGWRATADEQARVEATVAEAYANQLTSLRSLLHETVTEREREFANILELGLVTRTDEIRNIVRTSRFVRQIFVIAPDGRITHPPEDAALCNDSEREFFRRTAPIGLSAEIFASGADASPVTTPGLNWVEPENPAAAGQQGVEVSQAYLSQQQALSNSVSQQVGQAFQPPTSFATDQGWYSWFYGDGAQIIYWRKISGADYTLGIEVDREALMAELIAKLPTDAGAGNGGIVLTDASARPIYQWGDHDPSADTTPSVSIPLFPPLSMWHLNHYAPETAPGSLSTGNILSLISGVITAAVVLLALAVYFYRENSREMRTAAEKVTFVNQVSHELKTPLTNIRMYAELAEEKIPAEDDGGARRCLDIVVNESQRLSRLIGNVLTFAKPKAQQPNPTTNIPDDLIRATVEHFRPALTSQGIAIEIDLQAGAPVRLDADILEQILGNLLSNAEKYAAGGKLLQVTSAQPPGKLLVGVTDRGPGIPRSQREKIFKPFHRLSSKNSDGVSGTGIGLTIARDLARRHGGDLTLTEHKDPSGCQFTLVLGTSPA